MVGKNINVNQAGCVVLLKLRVVKSTVVKKMLGTTIKIKYVVNN
jgi:hypothetical protein